MYKCIINVHVHVYMYVNMHSTHFSFSACRLSDLQMVHTSEVAKLQHSLQEEREGRMTAQRSLEELRGEVAIGIDDASLSGSAGPGGGESNRLESFSKPFIVCCHGSN